MAVTVTVLGTEKLDRKAEGLLAEARRFQRRISSATRRAVEHNYKPVLVGMVPAFMPGGYAPTLAASLQVKTSVRFAGSSPGVSVVVAAPTGGPKGRAVNALEAGVLRHPLFGNKRHWYAQRVRRGFTSVPLKAIHPVITREIDQELAQIARDVERG